MIKAARSYSSARAARDARVRDAVRERDAARINEAVLAITSDAVARMNEIRKRGETGKALDENIEVVDWGVRTFGSYVGM
jgi:exportin-T